MEAICAASLSASVRGTNCQGSIAFCVDSRSAMFFCFLMRSAFPIQYSYQPSRAIPAALLCIACSSQGLGIHIQPEQCDPSRRFVPTFPQSPCLVWEVFHQHFHLLSHTVIIRIFVQIWMRGPLQLGYMIQHYAGLYNSTLGLVLVGLVMCEEVHPERSNPWLWHVSDDSVR